MAKMEKGYGEQRTEDKRKEADDLWIKFERDTNELLEKRGVQYRVVYLPEKDLMPYQHAETTTQLENVVGVIRERMRKREMQLWKNHLDPNDEPMEQITVGEEEAEVLEMALMVYKSALLAMHGKVMRSPAKPILWEDDYDGSTYPACPNCHELAYDIDTVREKGMGTCPFCGQRYTLAAEDKERAEPNPEETLTCPICGQETMVGRRAKSNGHFHGACTNCGARMIE